MSNDKRWRLVCYDVRDPKRYRQAFKILKGAGRSLQYSIFRCRLDDRATEKLRWELNSVLNDDDSLLIIDLCPSCAGRVIAKNHVEGWADEVATFRLIAPIQASEGGAKRGRRKSGTSVEKNTPPRSLITK